MNPNAVLKFLQSLRSLAKSGAVKTVDQAMNFAKREFGEVTDLLKRQIEQVFRKPDGGITSIKKPKKGEVIEASFKPGMDKRGRVVEESPSQASGTIMDRIGAASNRMDEIQKEIDAMYKPKPETSPLMQKLEKGVETLKEMKQPGMDLTTGLTRTIARSILNKKGIQVPERADPITVLEDNFGGDVLINAKDVAEELIELERMGISTKSMDEILEQSGMFDIKRNPDAPKGMSDEEVEQIKKQVDQEKMLKDFDPTDRTENSMGGINRVAYRYGSGKSLIKFLKGKNNLVKKIKQAVNDIFKTDDIKYDVDVAVDTMLEDLGVDRSMFDQKDIIDAYSMAYNELKIPLLQNLKNKPVKSMESMKKTGTLDISDPEIAGEMDRFAKQADPEGYKKMEEAMKKAADEAQPIEYFLGTRKKNSKGGLQYLMGM